MQQVTKRREGRGQERELSCFFISATFLFPLTEKSVENRDGAKVVKRERERIDYRIASLGKLLAEERFVRKTSAERLRSVYLTKYFGKMSRKSALSRNFKKKKTGLQGGRR